MRILIIAASALLAVGLSACGNSTTTPDPRANVAQAYNEWNRAVATGEYQKACQRLTRAALAELESALDAHNSCASVLVLAMAEDAKSFKTKAQPSDVRLHGRTAVVRPLVRGDGPTKLRQVNGAWLIDADAKPNPNRKPEPTKEDVAPVSSMTTCPNVPGARDVKTGLVSCTDATSVIGMWSANGYAESPIGEDDQTYRCKRIGDTSRFECRADNNPGIAIKGFLLH